MKVIKSERLILRPVSDSDAAPTARLMTATIAGNLSSWPHPISLEQAREKVARSSRMLEQREGVDFAIRHGANGDVMGWIGLVRVAPESAALGYWLGENFWSQGYATEAVRAFLPVGAKVVRATQIRAFTSETNRSSIAVLEKNGFECRGVTTLFASSRGRDEICLEFHRTLNTGK